ncbi:hypothetical protein SAMN00768000_3630 [Sulfobacillus thermosulfidooxidans DSM 9293]|uniref:DUF6922 domain-containing protein n=2 Tax=Sulfobacillus thermosulfidooxidans TaxID=28034 RepID=A0A1W1WPD5_SULTA|nr:hypothetical protein [Sulfobacillus thermosulfidooxidans]PSR22589.1 MAG: hypothetical protein C7B47_16560 [Sulfobacillus thermosulfidooxidans]SMC08072.1 hypothetical protein SAMN00768000_3630 [Sulfobacillus thermosulfidooxidans DSM 9293]
MTLPPSLHRLFYRYHADQLDTERHAALIIPTVLADGDFPDWDWLFAVYGWDTIQQWIQEPGHAASLPPPMEWLWTAILLGTPQETPRWSGGNARRSVPPDALPAWFPPEWR